MSASKGWILPCLWRSLRPVPGRRPIHVLISLCDHYEPGNNGAPVDQANQRVANWVDQYPKLFGKFRDSDGRPPRHSFFYPIEMYRAEELDALAGLCRQGFGEVEVHLHHKNDNAENLRKTFLDWKKLVRDRHGLLCRDPKTGETRYAFIHGNWALDNSHPDGKFCGVNNELDVLRETGCYADFTFPSYPDPTQTTKINSIYYAVDDPQKPKSHDWGTDAGRGNPPANSLLLIQGPLVFNWRSRKFGIVPRLENGNVQGNQALDSSRLNLWLRAGIQVPSRSDWFFVKLHTHGAPEANQAVLLGEPAERFHDSLARRAAEDKGFFYHYVTARETYNLVKAAEAGWTGSVAAARDFELLWQS